MQAALAQAQQARQQAQDQLRQVEKEAGVKQDLMHDVRRDFQKLQAAGSSLAQQQAAVADAMRRHQEDADRLASALGHVTGGDATTSQSLMVRAARPELHSAGMG